MKSLKEVVFILTIALIAGVAIGVLGGAAYIAYHAIVGLL